MSHVIAHWANKPGAPRVVFVDTRGPGHIAFSPFFFLAALARIIGLALSGRRTVLHVNVSNKGSAVRKFIVVALASLLRLRMVLHSHDGSLDRAYPRMPRLAQAAVRWMFSRGDRVVVLGDHWKRYFAEQIRVPPDRIEVVCNGVPAPPGPPGRPAADGVLRIVFLGRLAETKGVPELLAALASERVARLSWHATLAGDGDCGPYRSRAEAHGLSERIAFPGWLDKPAVGRLLAQADILVLPSHFEGLPMAVIEALANAVPVICTPVGALPDYLVDGRSALFVKPGDARSLALALERLIGSPELRETLAAEGHEVFLGNFDVAITARKLEQVYRRVALSSLH